jgi:hypothetical protein
MFAALFSPDTMLVVGAIACLAILPRLYGAMKGRVSLPSMPAFHPPANTTSTATGASGVIVDQHDTIEQVGFAHLQGAIHALRQSPRTKPEDLEALAAFAGKMIDLVEPANPIAPPAVPPATEAVAAK